VVEKRELNGLYGWIAVTATLGAAVAAFVSWPWAPLSLLAGAVAVTLPFATWHWMLLRRRRGWQYLAVFGGKLALLGFGFYTLGLEPRIHDGAFVIGMALVMLGAFAFGIDVSRGWIRKEAA
jgi:hypothetical protein